MLAAILVSYDKLYRTIGIGHFISMTKPFEALAERLRAGERHENPARWIGDISHGESSRPV